MQTFNYGDSKWDLLKKILLNQATILSLLGGFSAGSTFQAGPDITVLAAGTAVQGLNIPTPNGVLVVARLGNTGSCYLGGSEVSNNSGGKRGIELTQAGMPSIRLWISNMNQLFVNADNPGDRVGVVIL